MDAMRSGKENRTGAAALAVAMTAPPGTRIHSEGSDQMN